MSFQSQSINLPSDLFALAVHPTEPLLAAGLSSGHVYSYTWPATSNGADGDSDDDSDDDDTSPPPRAPSTPVNYTTAWKTRRHKGSCRTLCYSSDGSTLYTAGLDGLIKAASSSTGVVHSKALLPSPSSSSSSTDSPTSILPLSPEHLLIGTDLGHLHLFDLRTNTLTKPAPSATWKALHTDYVSSLLALPASDTSVTGFSRQLVTTGDTTLCHVDARKPGGPLARSEDQEDELLCSGFIASAPSRQTGGSQKILTGTGSGVVTAWNRGFWEDHQDRLPIARATGDAVEALLPLPSDFDIPGVKAGKASWKHGIGAAAGHQALFAAGAGDGKIRIVKLGGNKTLATLAHSYSADEAKRMAGGKVKRGDYEVGLEEGVAALGLTADGKLVSGGGMVVKVWTAVDEEDGDGDEGANGKRKKGTDSDDDSDADGGDKSSDEDEDSDDSDEEKEKKKRKKKKRKGGVGKARSIGVKNVATFKGLD